MTFYSFISFVNSLTHVWEGIEICIDYTFIKELNKYHFDNGYVSNNTRILIIILKSSVTDHFPIYIQIIPNNIKKPMENNDKIINIRKSFNKNNLKILIKNEIWNNSFNLTSIIKDIIKKCNSYTTHTNIVPIKPRITKGLLNSIKTRDLLPTFKVKEKTL